MDARCAPIESRLATRAQSGAVRSLRASAGEAQNGPRKRVSRSDGVPPHRAHHEASSAAASPLCGRAPNDDRYLMWREHLEPVGLLLHGFLHPLGRGGRISSLKKDVNSLILLASLP